MDCGPSLAQATIQTYLLSRRLQLHPLQKDLSTNFEKVTTFKLCFYLYNAPSALECSLKLTLYCCNYFFVIVNNCLYYSFQFQITVLFLPPGYTLMTQNFHYECLVKKESQKI